MQRNTDSNDWRASRGVASATAPPPTVNLDDPVQTLRGLIRASAAVIRANRNTLNALNVFPVPDGDTGTNMMMTLEGMEEMIDESKTSTFQEFIENVAEAALMKSRGNSGLILSPVFKGMRIGFDGESGINGRNFASSLMASIDIAYDAVDEPREGTMLTVIKDSAHAAQKVVDDDIDATLMDIIRCAADEAMRSVERTPELLEDLKDAGVIDSGGWGLALMFESMYRYLNGEGEITIMLEPPVTELAPGIDPFDRSGISVNRSFIDSIEEEEWGYCTVFAIKGSDLNIASLKAEMAEIGRSPVIVGDETLVKVHVHTEDPGQALTAGVQHGALSNIDINNMDVQAAQWSADRLQSNGDGANGSDPATPLDVGVLAVVLGPGIAAYFRNFEGGAVNLIEGGDTMNPSVEQILEAIESVRSDAVIVLPNNSNIVGTARQAAELSVKDVRVVPTTSMQAGAAAIGMFHLDADVDEIIDEMTETLDHLRVGDVFPASRDSVLGDVTVRQGEYLVRVDGEALAASDDEVDLLIQGVQEAWHDGAAVFVFVGADQDSQRANEAATRLRELTAGDRRAEVHIIDGGQPNYNFLFSIE